MVGSATCSRGFGVGCSLGRAGQTSPQTSHSVGITSVSSTNSLLVTPQQPARGCEYDARSRTRSEAAVSGEAASMTARGIRITSGTARPRARGEVHSAH